MFGKWKWVAGMVAYLPLVGLMTCVLGVLIAFRGIDAPGSAGLGAFARGFYIYFYVGLLIVLLQLVSTLWFTILLGKKKSTTTGKLLFAFLGLVMFPVIIAPICFHVLNKPEHQ
jgi:hypothetical protein